MDKQSQLSAVAADAAMQVQPDQPAGPADWQGSEQPVVMVYYCGYRRTQLGSLGSGGKHIADGSLNIRACIRLQVKKM